MRYSIIILFFIVLSSCEGKRQEDRFKAAVINLRELGLFEKYKRLDDEEVTKVLFEQAKNKYQYGDFNEIFNAQNDNYWFELRVAELDDNRVWYHDLEAGTFKGSMVYAETVKEFGKLSGGFLQPENIKEEWISEKGPVNISFQDKDTFRIFKLESKDDWYNPDFFKHLESSMKNNGSPYELYMHKKTGQDVFVIRLTKKEKEQFEKKLKWELIKF
jgi:hypothetical protein